MLAIACAALATYPAAAIRMPPNVAPDTGLWLIMAASLGAVLSAYSALPKHPLALALNWLVVPLCCGAFYFLCWLSNPASVGNNAGMVLFFSTFTLGAPFWLPIAALLWHMAACNSVDNNESKQPHAGA
ncbi:hypothetical protein [Niveibacterium sp.]|uniref:hypothetical protein n=1 Tax=Niveibacterium sp. TaxID=2017444 RepID=UPI0035B2494B